MTTLDLEPYLHAAGDEWDATCALGMLVCLFVIIVFSVGISARTLLTVRGTKGHDKDKACTLIILVVGLGLTVPGAVSLYPKAVQRVTTTWPSFAEYVESSYGLDSTDLPMSSPGKGSLPVVWEQDGEIHSGTLNLLDNKVSIKETNGDYLEVVD